MCSNNEEKELGPKVGLNGDKRKSFEKVKSCQVKFLEGILTILIETFHFVHQHFFRPESVGISRFVIVAKKGRHASFSFPLLYFGTDSSFLENMDKKIWKFRGQLSTTNILRILFVLRKENKIGARLIVALVARLIVVQIILYRGVKYCDARLYCLHQFLEMKL